MLLLLETRIQDLTSLLHLRSPRCPAGAKFTLRVSGDPASSSRGYIGVGIALSTRAEKALLEWNVRLDSSIGLNKQRNAKRHLFVGLAYAPMDCSTEPKITTENFLTCCEVPNNVTLYLLVT